MPTINVAGEDCQLLEEVAAAFARAKKVVVITGAGISTNCGIPDFRSENGLYNLIQSHYDAVARESEDPTPNPTRPNTPYVESGGEETPASSQGSTRSSSSRNSLPSNMKGKDLFDSRIWTDPLSTSVFYTFIASLRKKIREEVNESSRTHKFIKTLRDGGRLVRCYTQNIDGLEAREDLCLDMSRGKGNRARFSHKVLSKLRPEEPILPGDDLDGGCEVVQLHGDLQDLRCGLCNKLSSWEEHDRELSLLGGEAPECHACSTKNETRQGKGKRGTSVGVLRPNVVLYGEEHPSSHILSPISTHDLSLGPNTLLILGTSLRVHGLKVLVREFAKAVHARGGGKGKVIFINRTKPPESVWSDIIDYWVGMDCDDWVADLHSRRPDIWLKQGVTPPPTMRTVPVAPAKPRPLGVLSERDPNIQIGGPVDTTGDALLVKPKKPPRKRIAKPKILTDGVENAPSADQTKPRKPRKPRVKKDAKDQLPNNVMSVNFILNEVPKVRRPQKRRQKAPPPVGLGTTPSSDFSGNVHIAQQPTPPTSGSSTNGSAVKRRFDDGAPIFETPVKKKRKQAEPKVWEERHYLTPHDSLNLYKTISGNFFSPITPRLKSGGELISPPESAESTLLSIDESFSGNDDSEQLWDLSDLSCTDYSLQITPLKKPNGVLRSILANLEHRESSTEWRLDPSTTGWKDRIS